MLLKPYISLQEYDKEENYDILDEAGNPTGSTRKVTTLYIGISVLIPDGYIIRLRKPIPMPETEVERSTCVICLELFQARAQRYYGPQNFLLSLVRKNQEDVIRENSGLARALQLTVDDEKLWKDLEEVEVRVVCNEVDDASSSVAGFFHDDTENWKWDTSDPLNFKIIGKPTVGKASMLVSTAGKLVEEEGFDPVEAKKQVTSSDPLPIKTLLDLGKNKIGRVVGPDTKPQPPLPPPPPPNT